MQFVSPALPIGSFAYSEALEYAVEAGWVTSEASAQDWILGRLDDGIGRLDAPIVVRLWRAFRDQSAAGDASIPADALHWSRMLWALRESAELRAADRDLGRSLARLLVTLGNDSAKPWLDCAQISYAALFALAAVERDIGLDATVTGYLYAWSEAQMAAAIKLVPLGQSAGQRILSAAVEALPALVVRAQSMPDEQLGAGAPGLAIASSLHETMYVRLFRS